MSYWIGGGYAVESGTVKLSELQHKWEFKNLTNVTINGKKFYSDQYLGEFVIYKDSAVQFRGLKIYKPWNPWIEKGRYEIGLRDAEFDVALWFPGKYPQTSTRFLSSSDLTTLSKDDLKKMRNEIFARYDYIFDAGSEMDQYFKQQGWYRRRYANVSEFLTTIELANISLIKRLESIR